MLPILFHRNRIRPAVRAWDPFAGVSRLLDLADEPLNCKCGFNADVREDDERYLIEADLPGLAREDVEVTVEDGELKIAIEHKQDETREDQGYHIRERRYGNATRTFGLPDEVNADAITAEMKNGVLTVAVPKTEAAKPTTVKVNVE